MIETVNPGTPAPETSIIPEHPGGGQWAYAATALSGTTYFADSVTEIIEATLPGYVELKYVDNTGDVEFFDEGNDLALVMRYDDLIGYATGLQESILNTAIESGAFDPTSVSEDVLTALMAERIVPFEGIPLNDDPADVRVNLEWNLEVPLVLLTSDYVPFTERHEPSGNIIWLDPTTELTYLRSLDRLGVMKLLVAE
jgi:hypothetical protein